jgi:predicted GNAT family N-acyltransferase
MQKYKIRYKRLFGAGIPSCRVCISGLTFHRKWVEDLTDEEIEGIAKVLNECFRTVDDITKQRKKKNRIEYFWLLEGTVCVSVCRISDNGTMIDGYIDHPYLSYVATAIKVRGRGYMRHLLKYALDKSEIIKTNRKNMVLLVRGNNLSAKTIYGEFGFLEKEGRQDNTEQNIIMERPTPDLPKA